MHAMSKKITFFLLKEGSDLMIETFLVSQVCTINHLLSMASPFEELPFDVKLNVFCLFF